MMTSSGPDRRPSAVLAIWTDIAPELEADFNEWYRREHLPERLAVPGFRHGRRYRAIAGNPRYFAWYEIDSIDVLVSPAYLERLDNPTDWTRRIMPGFRNTTRAVLRIAERVGDVAGAVALTWRMAPGAAHNGEQYRHFLASLQRRPGIVRTQLWQAEAVTAPPTREAALRSGADGICAAALFVEGATLEELTPVADEIAARNSPFALPGDAIPVSGTYSMLCSLDTGGA